jgi:hypothetical protein
MMTMATRLLAFERGGPNRLELSWDFNWRNFTVLLDGALLGKIEGGLKALTEGRSFQLPDGSTLHIGMKQQALGLMLDITRDGKTLPGSPTDPIFRLRNALLIVYLIGAALIVTGALNVRPFSGMEDAGISVIAGIVFVVLGYLAQRRVAAALLGVMALYILGIAAVVASARTTGSATPILVLAGSIYPLMLLWQGIVAIRELKAAEATAGR